MSCTVDAYMAQAASHIGFHEGYDNITPFGAWYGPGFQGSPWCDEYVSYNAAQAGGADIIGKFAYTPSHANWFVSRNQWHSYNETPIRGDILFIATSGSKAISAIEHVATVESVDDGGVVTTIDGNWNNQVMRVVHPRSTWVGFGRPAYDGASSAANDAVPAVFLQNAAWDGVSFPGASVFFLGSYHPAVTVLGQRLVAHGFGQAYKVGPGVPMGPADVTNTAAFQRAQGWSGSDADGYPGPATWAALMAAPAAAQAAPAAQPAAQGSPTVQGYQGDVYLGKLHRGQTDSDSVKVYQRALRNYPGISTIPLNPSGVTGNYGDETVAMTERVYTTLNQRFPGQGWGDGDLGVPGRALLAVLGCKIVG